MSEAHPTPLLRDLASRSKSRQQGLIPGTEDEVGYWLTPPEVMEPLQAEFEFAYDPCPFPRPSGYDGLKEEWGSPAWVNPPWEAGAAGPMAWARKCIAEARKGKDVVMIFPQDKWVNARRGWRGDPPHADGAMDEPCRRAHPEGAGPRARALHPPGRVRAGGRVSGPRQGSSCDEEGFNCIWVGVMLHEEGCPNAE